MLFQRFPQYQRRRDGRISASQYHNVNVDNLQPMESKAFSGGSFYAISCNSCFNCFFCDSQTQPSMRQVIGCRQHRKILVRGFYGIFKYIFKISGCRQSELNRKAKIFRRQLNRQRSAAFGSTRINDSTTAHSCHSGTKAVSSSAFYFTWLISSFHDYCLFKKRIKKIWNDT